MHDNSALDQLNEIKIFHHFAVRLTYKDKKLRFIKNSDDINPAEKLIIDYKSFRSIIETGKIGTIEEGYKNYKTVCDLSQDNKNQKILLDILKRKNQLLSDAEAMKLYVFKVGDFKKVNLCKENTIDEGGPYWLWIVQV